MSDLFKNAIRWDFFNKPNTQRLWLYLLMNAAEKETVINGEKIYPGQMLYDTNKQIMYRTGLTRSQFNTAIRDLDKLEYIVYLPLSHGCLITICDYDKLSIVMNACLPT